MRMRNNPVYFVFNVSRQVQSSLGFPPNVHHFLSFTLFLYSGEKCIAVKLSMKLIK